MTVENDRFTETWERDWDADGTIRVKATCNRCGMSQLLNVADGSLRRWEQEHQCPDMTKEPSSVFEM